MSCIRRRSHVWATFTMDNVDYSTSPQLPASHIYLLMQWAMRHCYRRRTVHGKLWNSCSGRWFWGGISALGSRPLPITQTYQYRPKGSGERRRGLRYLFLVYHKYIFREPFLDLPRATPEPWTPPLANKTIWIEIDGIQILNSTRTGQQQSAVQQGNIHPSNKVKRIITSHHTNRVLHHATAPPPLHQIAFNMFRSDHRRKVSIGIVSMKNECRQHLLLLPQLPKLKNLLEIDLNTFYFRTILGHMSIGRQKHEVKNVENQIKNKKFRNLFRWKEEEEKTWLNDVVWLMVWKQGIYKTERTVARMCKHMSVWPNGRGWHATDENVHNNSDAE